MKRISLSKLSGYTSLIRSIIRIAPREGEGERESECADRKLHLGQYNFSPERPYTSLNSIRPHPLSSPSFLVDPPPTLGKAKRTAGAAGSRKLSHSDNRSRDILCLRSLIKIDLQRYPTQSKYTVYLSGWLVGKNKRKKYCKISQYCSK